MNKIRVVFVCLLIPFFVLTALTLLKIKKEEAFQQKAVLAREIHKALDHLMLDIYQMHEGPLYGVPADGLWHEGGLGYWVKDRHLFLINKGNSLLIADDIADLRMRRQKAAPDILEIQIEAKKDVSLIFNLKTRIRQ